MKRMKTIIMSLLLSASLVGCGSGQSQEPKEISDLNFTDTLGDSVNFSVYGLETVAQLDGVATINPGLVATPSDPSNEFLDFVINVTNNGSQKLNPFADFEATYEIDGNTYDATVETEDGDVVANFNEIQPKSTAYVHIYTEINESQLSGDIFLSLTYGSVSNKYKLDKENLVPQIQSLSYGDVITNDNQDIEIAVVKSYKTKKLEPPVKGEYFTSSYTPTDQASTYAIVELSLTNKTSTDLSVNDTVSAIAYVDGTYEYTGFITTLSEDQTNFDSYASISPNTTRMLYSIIEVPDNVINDPVEFEIHAFKKPYKVSME